MIDKPYFCVSSAGARTANHPSMEDAIAEACALKLAPFTIWQLTAQPIGVRQTNMAARYPVVPPGDIA